MQKVNNFSFDFNKFISLGHQKLHSMMTSKLCVIRFFILVLTLCISSVDVKSQSAFLDKSIVLDTLNSGYRVAKSRFLIEYSKYKNLQLQKMKKTYKDKAGKEMVKIYNESYEGIVSQVNDNQFIFHPKTDSLIRNTLSKFKIAEIPDPNQVFFLVSKDLSLNAFCLSDGLLLINAGLFLWLNNEEQFASVLAHELGHYVLDHYNKYLYQNLEHNYSKQNKRNLDKLLYDQTENQSKTAKTILRQNAYNHARQYRKHELEADSIGYAFYVAGGFKKSEYIKAMNLMIKYEKLPILTLDSSVYYKLFDLPEQHFKQAWLEGEDFDQYHYFKKEEEYHEDSLQSHPPIEVRIQNLKNYYTIDADTTTLEPSEDFYNVSTMVGSEVLPIFYYNEDYGSALYGVIRHLSNDTQNNYLRSWLGLLFSKIYDARKNYTLNRYIEAVDKRDTNASYQQFLSFIWQLNLKEIKTIADHYSKNSSLKN